MPDQCQLEGEFKIPRSTGPLQPVRVFRLGNDTGESDDDLLLDVVKLGMILRVELAAKRSRYARRVLDCLDALEQLQTEFPDASRRPYGEKSLRSEIALPFMAYEVVERVISKIKNRKWTAHDLAQISGHPPEQSHER